MKLIFLSFLLLLCSTSIFGVSAQVPTYNLSDYLKEGEKDATLAMVTMMQEASKSKNSKVIIAPGTYHFYPEKAFEQYSFITNHDNSLRRIAFPINEVDGMTIEGNNAQLIFHGVMMPFNIERSKNVNIKGLTIDWHLPLHGEATVAARDTVAKTFDLRLAKNMPYTIRNEQLIFIKEGFEHDLDHAILYDPERKAIAYRNYDYVPIEIDEPIEIRNKDQFDFPNYVDLRRPAFEAQDVQYRIRAEELEPGLVRIYNHTKKMPPVGMVLVVKGRFGKDRIANAFHIHKSSQVMLEDITIYYAGGMGVLGERSEDITLENITIVAHPDKNLMVSTSADAAHFAGCRGSIVVNNCNFRHQLDDAINIHGAYVLVEDILSVNKIGVRIGHFQQAGFEFAASGDTIGFIDNSTSADVIFKTPLKDFYKLNQDYYILTLEDGITDKIAKGFVVENLDWYPEVTLTNNEFADNRARGLLLKSPRKTIVKNNYFSNMMQAIMISGGINNWWYESGGAQDMLIEGNTFGDCNYDGGKRPVIIIGGKFNGKGRVLGDIVINNNTFQNFNPSILRARGVRNLEFTNSTIENSESFESTFPNQYVIDAQQIENMKIEKVKISKDFKKRLFTDQITNLSSDLNK